MNKENHKILLIAIGNVLKNKYIHIVNNIVCVFQMSIIMQILSMYVITDKQKDVSHDVIMVKCYQFCYYLYIHVHSIFASQGLRFGSPLGDLEYILKFARNATWWFIEVAPLR